MASIRMSDEFVAKILTSDLQAFENAHPGSGAFLSVTELATRVGCKVDAVERVLRGMPNVKLLPGNQAADISVAAGVSFDIASRKGKEKGFYPGVRLMGEDEAIQDAIRRDTENKAGNAYVVTLTSDFQLAEKTVSVRFDDEGNAIITVKGGLAAALAAVA